ncbi:MAG: hypothetical protein O7F76_14130, partial [Planctomycetota bacterium]|nr:hypothetical protein [Planctomycetota bacterium]
FERAAQLRDRIQALKDSPTLFSVAGEQGISPQTGSNDEDRPRNPQSAVQRTHGKGRNRRPSPRS